MTVEGIGNLARRALSASRWLFGPAAALFLIAAGWRARALVATVLEQTNAAPLIAAVVLWALLHMLTPVFSWIVLREVGADISYRMLLRIHAGRLPARYLPGGIWHTVSRVMDLHRLGVSRSRLSVMVLLENTLPLAIALILGGTCLCLGHGPTWQALAAVFGGSLAGAGAFLLLRHRSLRQARPFALGSYLKLAAVTTLFWVLAATAFYCYWSAFPVAGDGVPALQLYGVYLLAWAVGFITIFAPQGIGVFESVAGLFLRGALTFEGAAVLAAGFRVAILGADALVFSIITALRWRDRMRRAQAH